MKKINYILFFINVFILQNAFSLELNDSSWMLKSSEMTYHVSFLFKNPDGTSKLAKGKGQCDKVKCQFLIATEVKSFTSSDSNRDLHMLEVTKAALHPMVVIKLNFTIEEFNKNLVNATIQFSGKEHTYSNIKNSFSEENGNVQTKGRIDMKLSDFNIERPSLLGAKIDDLVPVDYDITWSKVSN